MPPLSSADTHVTPEGICQDIERGDWRLFNKIVAGTERLGASALQVLLQRTDDLSQRLRRIITAPISVVEAMMDDSPEMRRARVAEGFANVAHGQAEHRLHHLPQE